MRAIALRSAYLRCDGVLALVLNVTLEKMKRRFWQAEWGWRNGCSGLTRLNFSASNKTFLQFIAKKEEIYQIINKRANDFKTLFCLYKESQSKNI
ncbi:hypothetical protein A6770_40330 [Nostoc minutum NIES-26]|uniref:Uncharacterized protein n=1 Tax=Nostoc minutum NIES-26 TaxID=1844469 RepID=A0A367RNH8_9NOSO|nr:hypothetical protein A6770_40330 [Nostoc minutum NIES-26]